MKHIIVIAALTAGCLPALAHEENDESLAEEAIDYRSGIMEVMGWNMKRMGAVIKGKARYDQATFARTARDLNATAHLDVLAGFPEDSDEGDDTDAKSEIWLDWENFTAKLDRLRKETDSLTRVSASGDLDAIKAQFGKVGKACKGCHKEYRK